MEPTLHLSLGKYNCFEFVGAAFQAKRSIKKISSPLSYLLFNCICVGGSSLVADIHTHCNALVEYISINLSYKTRWNKLF